MTMGHCLQAIIGKEQDILNLNANWLHAHAKALAQGFFLLRLNDQWLDDINELVNNHAADPYPQFSYLSAALSDLLQTHSHRTKLAYIETDYFGGTGAQSAMLYENGQIVIAPLRTEDKWDTGRQTCYQTPPGERAINTVLKRLGVVCVNGCDEFDSILLGKERR
jgi:hypothetical protein